MRKTAGRVFNLLFPARCPYCDRIVTPVGEKIHAQCMGALKVLAPPYCMKCGRKTAGEHKLCAQCAGSEHFYIRGRCLYEYPAVAQSIYRFKYLGRREYADFYGEQAAEYLGEFIRRVKPDALVPIPIHRRRYAVRGYNQAGVLARRISEYTGIPVAERLLIRRKNTVTLKVLSGPERQKNLKNAFIVRGNSVKLKTIILIDDIYTTGATADEAARTLSEAGIPDVYFVALAGGNGL